MGERQRHSARLLLIGVTGQVGRALTSACVAWPEVIATARNPANAPAETRCLQLEVSDLDAVRTVVRDVRPTAIINAAAYTAVDRAESESEVAMTVNAGMPGVLAEEAERVGAALIHFSTDYVFDGSGTRPWREEDVTQPLSVYGRSKLAGEQAIRNSGAAHLILRISWIYAPRGQNFVRTMLKLGCERTELRVVADQCGAPTPASCVAQATAKILTQAGDSPAEFFQTRGGIVHLPCAGETTWHAFAEEVFRRARVAGVPLRVERVTPIATAEYPTPAVRPLNSRLDGTRAYEKFGVRLPDWKAALAAEFPHIVAAM